MIPFWVPSVIICSSRWGCPKWMHNFDNFPCVTATWRLPGPSETPTCPNYSNLFSTGLSVLEADCCGLKSPRSKICRRYVGMSGHGQAVMKTLVIGRHMHVSFSHPTYPKHLSIQRPPAHSYINYLDQLSQWKRKIVLPQ